MNFRCPKCRREHQMNIADFEKGFSCGCGYRLDMEHEEVFNRLDDICREFELEREEGKLAEVKRAQDRIIVLILDTDYPKVDVEIEISKFRDLVNRLFPGKMHLYEMIYEPRFKRLWEQFRETGEEAEER
jgi:hypothetical protein